MDQRVSQLLFLEQLFDGVDFRQEPGDDHHLATIIFSAVDQVGERVQLGRGNLLRGGVRVIAYKAARQLGQTQKPCQHVGHGHAAGGKVGVAVLHQLQVHALGRRFQFHPLHDVGAFRQIKAFGLRRPKGDAVQLLGEFRLHAFLHDRRIIAIAHHVEIAIAEQIEAAAEHGGIGEFVLAEHVDGLVGDDRAGEQQAIPRLRAQPVQCLAGGDIVGLDLVTLVADDHVRPPRGQLLFQAPCALVIHHQHLQRRAGHMPNGVRLPRARAFQHGERIVVIREFAEFVLPHAENGQRRDHQQTADVAA